MKKPRNKAGPTLLYPLAYAGGFNGQEETLIKTGAVQMALHFDGLLTFDTRDEAGEYVDTHRNSYPNRIIQISYHIGKDQLGNNPALVKI